MTILEDELERLAEKATPGPWDFVTGDMNSDVCVHGPNHANEMIAELTSSLAEKLRALSSISTPDAANAALIVALRNNLPAILEALRTQSLLREALSALEPFAKEAAEWGVNGKPLPDDFQIEVREAGYPATPALFNLGDLRRARAAADEIRASLTQEKQT